jgi:hypothetical protein
LQEFPFSVVGVRPREFNGTEIEAGPDVRAPLAAADRLERASPVKSFRGLYYEIVGRRRPRADVHQAESEAQILYRAALDEAGQGQDWNGRLEARPIPRGRSVLREKYSGALILLMIGVALVFLMICTNVGGIRAALGAGAAHILAATAAGPVGAVAAGITVGATIFVAVIPVNLQFTISSAKGRPGPSGSPAPAPCTQTSEGAARGRSPS